MNCSDNIGSDVVLPEENISSSPQTGMGCADINRLRDIMKSGGNDLVIIYDPDSAFQDVFSESLTVSPSCEYAGREQ